MLLLARPTRLAVTFLGLNLALAAGFLAQAKPSATVRSNSGVDIYGGYGFFQPLNSYVNGYQYHSIANPNATGSVAVYFTNKFGAQVEGSYFTGNNNKNNEYGSCAVVLCNQKIYTAEAGPIVRFPVGPFVPFVHALGGGVRMNGPEFQPLTWGYGTTVGAGVDYVFPFWGRHLAIRPAQVDYQYAHISYGPAGQATPAAPPLSTGGTANINAVKLSAGLVLHLKEANETIVPLIYGCSASPLEVYPGEPVTVTGSTVGLKSKKVPVYSWASKGGVVTSQGAVATIDTTGLEAGQYDVIGRISTGPRVGEQSYCSAPFTVKAYAPPTIACTASTNSAEVGAIVTITCTGRSEQNRALTYKFTTTNGDLVVNENVATLATAGLPPGNVTVTGTVYDDKGKSATATVLVVITAPPAPLPPPTPVPLCTLDFMRDVRRPARVDNKAKACLDDIALTLNRQSDAKLMIIGNSSPTERPTIAAERALNVRKYMIAEKGVDPNRISVRVGETSGQTVKMFLVPTGAEYRDENTHVFEEKRIILHGEAYGVHHPTEHKHVRHTPPPPANP